MAAMSEIAEKESFELFSGVPFFDGEPNGIQVDEFLDKIDMVGSLMHWKDETKITVAKLKLMGKAQLAVKYCNNFKDVTWDKFKEELKEYYPLPWHKVENLLLNCTRRRNETAREYAWRFLDIANKCGRLIPHSSREVNEETKGLIEQEKWCRIFLRHIDDEDEFYYDHFLDERDNRKTTGGTVKLSDIVNYFSRLEIDNERKPSQSPFPAPFDTY